jgi:DNA-binding CsgD family transcriptional regulator
VVIVVVLGADAEPSAEHLHARYGLSPREVEVARLLADGLSTRELSSALHVSTHTARHHTENVLRKLRVRRRAEVGRRLRGG